MPSNRAWALACGEYDRSGVPIRVQLMFSELQSSSDTIPGAEALAVVNILNDIDVALVSAVANGNSVSGFTANIGPVFDEANRLLTATK